MKFTAVGLTLAATVAAFTDAYSTTPCPWTEYLKLAPLASDPNLQPCQAASGWTMLPPSGYPTPAQLAIMCKTDTCFKLVDAVKATNPSDCVLVFGSTQINAKKLVDEFEPSCFSA